MPVCYLYLCIIIMGCACVIYSAWKDWLSFCFRTATLSFSALDVSRTRSSISSKLKTQAEVAKPMQCWCRFLTMFRPKLVETVDENAQVQTKTPSNVKSLLNKSEYNCFSRPPARDGGGRGGAFVKKFMDIAKRDKWVMQWNNKTAFIT